MEGCTKKICDATNTLKISLLYEPHDWKKKIVTLKLSGIVEF